MGFTARARARATARARARATATATARVRARVCAQPACRELELLELLSEHLRGRVRVAVSVRARARLGLGPGPGLGLGLEALRSSRHRSEHLLGVARHVLGGPVPVVAVLAVRALLYDPSLISLTDLGHHSTDRPRAGLGTWTGHAFGGRTFGASRRWGRHYGTITDSILS